MRSSETPSLRRHRVATRACIAGASIVGLHHVRSDEDGHAWGHLLRAELVGGSRSAWDVEGQACPKRRILEFLASCDGVTPSLAAQQAFVTLQSTIAALKARHAALREANATLIPATLERMFARRPA